MMNFVKYSNASVKAAMAFVGVHARVAAKKALTHVKKCLARNTKIVILIFIIACLFSTMASMSYLAYTAGSLSYDPKLQAAQKPVTNVPICVDADALNVLPIRSLYE